MVFENCNNFCKRERQIATRRLRYWHVIRCHHTYLVLLFFVITVKLHRFAYTQRYGVKALTSSQLPLPKYTNCFHYKYATRQEYHFTKITPSIWNLKSNDDDDNENDTSDKANDTNQALRTTAATTISSDILTRFTSPIIDDPGLPLSDVLVTQIIAPSLQILWISIQHGPQPTWVQPIFDTNLLYTTRGSYIVPTLIHGAALSSCWILGALAAKAYERKAISPVPILPLPTQSEQQAQQQQKQQQWIKLPPSKTQWDYSNVILAIVKSGAFAVGLLLLATQFDILLEYKRYVQIGESDDIDFRLYLAIVEVINDVFFEAITILTWRLMLAYQTERMARD